MNRNFFISSSHKLHVKIVINCIHYVNEYFVDLNSNKIQLKRCNYCQSKVNLLIVTFNMITSFLHYLLFMNEQDDDEEEEDF